ncbi:MAG: HAMP domain-containing sensor histidine kinase [Candidatus Paceibacterota bacterium]|jgi:signal transduction histidine kinase
MNQNKTIFKKLMKPTVIGVVILFISIAIIIFTSWMLYNRTVDILTQNLRDRLLTISITGAANIDSKDLEALQEETDWKKPEWARVVNQLHKIKYSNKDIVFMYIFRKIKSDPTNMEFVVDADSIDPYANTSGDPLKYVDVNRDGKVEPDGADKLQWPGQPYPEAIDIPEAYEAYNGPITVKDLYTDEYGTVLTGYAPIRDENGNTVAILATDVKADDFFTITKQTLQPFLIFIILLSLIISILIIVIIHSWNKHEKYLKEVNEKLKGLDKLKTEFLSLASHQLRSPLTAIKGYTSMLLEGDFGKVTAQQKEMIDRVFQSSQHLTKVVEDLLNVSKIEQGGMKYEMAPFDMNKVACDLSNDLTVSAQKKGLELTCENDHQESYMINGDMEKIRQVVLNLIDNSIKYTEKGFIKVSLSKNNGKVLFAVSDSGMGMTPEIKASLFQKFSRGEGGKVNTGGSGLGLYLAKEIVEAHHGRVWVESAGLGLGSTFIVELKGVE